MTMPEEFSGVTKGSTASVTSTYPATSRQVVVPFGSYDVVIRVTEDGRLLGIDEIRVRKDFLSHEQRIASSGCFDVDEFYRE